MMSQHASRRTRLPILMYHHVGPARPGSYPGMTVTPDAFARQIRWMARRGYVGIRPSDWLAWRRGEGVLPARPVLITLDDAYADIVEHAFPVLQEHGFQAGVYVVTDRLGGTNTWDEQGGWASHPLMTAEQILTWADRGIEFGAHTRTHRDLTTLSDGELEDEITGSGADLAQLLGTPPQTFAYPHGRYDDRALRLAQQSFALALSVAPRVNDAHTDLHQLRRAEVKGNDTLVDLACRLHFGTSPVRDMLRPIKHRLRALRERGRPRATVAAPLT